MPDNIASRKFNLLQTVLLSTLSPENKTLLCTLVILHNEGYGYAFPSVEWLCKARGVSHERNFKGVANYLPGLVSVGKRGRRNTYTLDFQAIEALPQNVVTLKHTPSLQEKPTGSAPARAAITPADAADTPSAAAINPATEGANSLRDTEEDSLENRTRDDSTSKEDDDLVLSDSPLADYSPPPAATSLAEPSPLGVEMPAPGDMRKRAVEGFEALELNGVTRSQASSQEDATEAHRAARRRSLLIERELERRFRSAEQRREVLARALALEDAGFTGRLDDLIDKAFWNGDEW